MTDDVRRPNPSVQFDVHSKGRRRQPSRFTAQAKWSERVSETNSDLDGANDGRSPVNWVVPERGVSLRLMERLSAASATPKTALSGSSAALKAA